MTKQRLNLIISLVAGCTFIILCCNNLGAQGFYNDELHQAMASFDFAGKNPTYQQANLIYNGIPILIMNYSGAIKSAIYGYYMRIFQQPFDTITWRLLGILMVCVGLVLFGILIRKSIHPIGLAAFYFLTLSDCTVLLTTRHDWGPTALALSLRLLLLAFWLRGETSEVVSPLNTFLLPFLFGISLFEKLSNLVLLIPLILMILLNPARWKNFHLPAAALGGILGGLPLIFANWLSFSRTHILISLQLSDYSFDISFIDHLRGYLSSGAGNLVQAFILGRNANVFGSLEMVLLLAILLLIIVQMIRYRSMEKQIRNMFVLLISYFAIMIQTYVFFHTIHLGVHHWILGTPFQYIAIALFISNWEEKTVVFKKKLFKYLVMALLIFFSLSRIAGLASMEDSLTRGDSTIAWDASLNRFAQFAASKSDSAYFLTTDWVEKNQLTCFMNGNDSSVLHRRVVGYPTVPQLFDTVKKSNRTELYILFPVPATALYLTPSEKQMILDEASRELSPEWQMVPVDKQFSNLRALEIVKYQKKR